MAPTQLVSDPIAQELLIVLARLRVARTVYPDHDQHLVNMLGERRLHIDCDVCTNEARLNWLLDKLKVPRTAA